MFFTSRQQMMIGLEAVRKQHCGYVNMVTGEAAATCDCKYGLNETSRHSEVTGCPEIRQALALLSVLREEEYVILLRRAGVHASSTDSFQAEHTFAINRLRAMRHDFKLILDRLDETITQHDNPPPPMKKAPPTKRTQRRPKP